MLSSVVRQLRCPPFWCAEPREPSAVPLAMSCAWPQAGMTSARRGTPRTWSTKAPQRLSFPEPAFALYFPSPSPPAVAQLPSSRAQAAVPQAAPSVAQGAREGRPRAAPICAPRAVVAQVQPPSAGDYRRPVPAVGGPAPPLATQATHGPPGAVPPGLAGSRPLATAAPPGAEACGKHVGRALSARAPGCLSGSQAHREHLPAWAVLRVCLASTEAARGARS